MPTWRRKSDARDPGASVVITAEPYVIGEDDANYVYLNEVPLQTKPSSVIVRQGTQLYIEVPGTPAASGQFRVFYSGNKAGALQFHAADNTKAITVDYRGTGSNLFARDINNLQDGIANAGSGLSGNGTPEGSVAALSGTLYRQLDAPDARALWIKTTATGTTGWARASSRFDAPATAPNEATFVANSVAIQAEETQRVLKLHTKLSDGSRRTLEVPLDQDLRSYTTGTINAATFTSGNTGVGLTGTLRIPVGTHDIEADVTITAHITFQRGAVLRPASGVTVYINGPFEAGDYKTFDYSLGGTFDFSSNTKQRHFNVRWFGVLGDGVTDDAPAINHAVDACFGPSNARHGVVNAAKNRRLDFPNGTYNCLSSIALHNLVGFHISGGQRLQTTIQISTLNTTLFNMDATAYGILERINFSANASQDYEHALVEVDWTGTYQGTLKSQQMTFRDCYFNGNKIAAVGSRVAKHGASAWDGVGVNDINTNPGHFNQGTQGDTFLFENCLWGGFTRAGLGIGSISYSPAQNALGIQLVNGNIQGCTFAGVEVLGGQVLIDGTSFQNQGTLGTPEALLQTEQQGADVYFWMPSASPSVLRNIRSESMTLVAGNANVVVENCQTYAGNIAWWAPSWNAPQGQLTRGNTSELTNTDGRAWVCHTPGVTGATQPNFAGVSTSTYWFRPENNRPVKATAGSNVIECVNGFGFLTSPEGWAIMLSLAGAGGGPLFGYVHVVDATHLAIQDAVGNPINSSATFTTGQCRVGPLVTDGAAKWLQYEFTSACASGQILRSNFELGRIRASANLTLVEDCTFSRTDWFDFDSLPGYHGGLFQTAASQWTRNLTVRNPQIGQGSVAVPVAIGTKHTWTPGPGISNDYLSPAYDILMRPLLWKGGAGGLEFNPVGIDRVAGAQGGTVHDNALGVVGLHLSGAPWPNSPSGPSGTDVAGKDFHVSAVPGTGAGTPGVFNVSVPQLGASGTATQSLAVAASFDYRKIALVNRLFQAAPATAPTESDFTVNSVSLQAEETQRVLKLHTKLSNGSRRTLEIPLDRDLRSYATAGVVNASSFATANTTIGSVGSLVIPPGTWDIETNTTITMHLTFLRGAMLRPASGVTVTILGPIDATAGRIFDLSLGGAVRFVTGDTNAPNPFIREYNLHWWCLLDGVTDDSTNIRNAFNSVPNYAKVVQPHHSCAAIQYTVTVIGRTGLKLIGDANPMDAFFGTPTCSWKWIGADGGIMLGDYANGYFLVDGIFFAVNNAAIGRDTDGLVVGTSIGSTNITINAWGGAVGGGPDFLKYVDLSSPLPITLKGGAAGNGILVTTITAIAADGKSATISTPAGSNNAACALGIGVLPPVDGRISTWCDTQHCKFIGGAGNKTWVGWRIAQTGGGNVDFMRGFRNYFYGGSESVVIPQAGIVDGNPVRSRGAFNYADGGYPVTGLQMTAGSNVVTATTATFDPDHNNRRFQLENGGPAGTGSNGTNGALDGFFLYDSPTSGRTFSDAACTIPLNAPRDINAGLLGHEPSMYIGQAYGTGILIGNNFNSHQNIFREQQFVSLHEGFRSNAGSFELYGCWGTDNDLNIYAGVGIQQPCYIRNWNSEDCRQHLFLDAGVPFVEEMTRHFVWLAPPSNSYFRIFTSSPRYENRGLKIEGNTANGSSVWSFNKASGALRMKHENAWYIHTKTVRELGWLDAGFPLGGSIDYEDLAFSGALPSTSGGDGLDTLFNGRGTAMSVISRGNGTYIQRLDGVILRTPGALPADSTFNTPGELAFFVSGSSVLAKANYQSGGGLGQHFMPKGGIQASVGYGGGDTLAAGQTKVFTISGVTGIKITDGVLANFEWGGLPWDAHLVITGRVTQSDGGSSNGIITITVWNPTAGDLALTNGVMHALTISLV